MLVYVGSGVRVVLEINKVSFRTVVVATFGKWIVYRNSRSMIEFAYPRQCKYLILDDNIILPIQRIVKRNGYIYFKVKEV